MLPCNRKPSPLSRSPAFQFFFFFRQEKKNNKSQRRIQFSNVTSIYGYPLWWLLYWTCFHVLRSHFLFGQCTGSVDQATVLQISRWSHLKLCRIFNNRNDFLLKRHYDRIPFFFFFFFNNNIRFHNRNESIRNNSKINNGIIEWRDKSRNNLF